MASLTGMIASCSDEAILPPDELPGTEYFRLEKGIYRNYNVDLIIFNLLESDTLNFQLREVVEDSFVNDANEITHILHRFVRPDEMSTWELDSVWTARKTRTSVLVVENNVPIVKWFFLCRRIQNGMAMPSAHELNNCSVMME